MSHDAVRYGLTRILYPCFMIFGTIGNVLCLKILLHKRFRRQSTCQYLCILAAVDIIFIYMRSTRFLYRYMFRVDIRNSSLWICRTFIFCSSTITHLASWILVVVSFDRYLIIKNLFRRRDAGWRVLISTVVLVIILCLVNMHYFYILGTKVVFHTPVILADNSTSNETIQQYARFVCIAHPAYQEFFRFYVPIFDLLFVAIIPFALMTFTNIGIIRTTMRSNTLRATSRSQQRNNHLTIMLLSVILAFMLLTCPSVIYICLNRITTSRAVSDTKLLILDILESLWYAKHTLNFILYTLSGQDFRREFVRLLPCCRRSTSKSLKTRHNFQNANNLTTNETFVSNKKSSITTRLFER